MIYNTLIYIIKFFVSLLKFNNEKISKLYCNHNKILKAKNIKNVIWFHCASLGEYEQAVTLINSIKKKYKNKILLTFFSPSGYENYSKNNNVDYVYYLPFDTKKNVKIFIKNIQPKMLFISGNDFWFNYLNILSHNKIPVYIFNATFKNQFYFTIFGYWFLGILRKSTYFYVKDKLSCQILKKYKIDNCKYIGNLRCDRIIEKKGNISNIKIINEFKNDKKLIVGGSTYNKDENILIEFLQKENDYKLIIAPHEINQKRINEIKRKFKNNCHLFSELENKKLKHNIIIIDKMNILFTLYQYADIIFIGGGFNKGIHNILEPLIFYKPVFFGPKYKNFDEAIYMIEKKAAYCVDSYAEVKKEKLNQKIKESIDQYFNKNKSLHSQIISQVESLK